MKKKYISLSLLYFLTTFLFLSVFIFFSINVVLAAGIDSTNKYAWGNRCGWINFGTTEGNVNVTNSAITGYAWSENYGWINLAPAMSGVKNDGKGNLSGYAWGENAGWINFSDVAINCSGKFTGTATGDIVGTINFDCTNCKILTDWRPSSGCGGGPFCGDGTCSGSETCSNCPVDCGVCQPVCGDGICDSNETCNSCSQDCGTCLPVPFCGDNICNGNEDCAICPSDCGVCKPIPFCGDGICSGDEACENCPKDCGTCLPVPFCGDAVCNGNETCATCSIDCGVCQPVCGDGICDSNEACNSCSQDCGTCLPVPFCGDNICNGNEDCAICPSDCGVCGSLFFCGDGTCNGDENCTSCSSDCGVCPPPPVCGDGTCNGDETCKSCSGDCGKCIIDDIIVPAIIETVDKVSEFVKTPEGSVVTKIISTTGVAAGIVVTTSVIVFSPFSIFELFLLPTRLFGFLLGLLGFRKKRAPWGVVYDSTTKQPLDPAYVVLKDSQGKEVSTAITDLDGRYGFLVDLGVYQMVANKTNYIFPSQKLAGRTQDELYEYLYFGEKIEIKSIGEAITRNIPLDPVKFDWNEFAKMDKKLMRFYSKWDLLMTKISDIFFLVGFIISVIAYFSAPYPYNTIIVGLYLFLLVLRILGLRPRSFGYVIEKATGNPLAFAIIRIILADFDKEVSHKITDRYGRYLCLLPIGRYYLKIEKKNDDESYSLVYTSSVINVSKKGIIKERFEV